MKGTGRISVTMAASRGLGDSGAGTLVVAGLDPVACARGADALE